MVNIIQDQSCNSVELECVNKIRLEPYKCLPPCSGLIITSFSRADPKQNFESLISGEVAAYYKYMKWFEFPSKLKGIKYFILFLFK